MAKQKKLAALLKATEVAEQDALQEHSRVQAVLDGRERQVAELRAKEQLIAKKLEATKSEGVQNAVLTGDTAGLAAAQSYGRRLAEQVVALRRELETHERDLEHARARARMTEEDLVRARVERKKVERLSANHEQSERIRGAAQEEVTNDEMNRFRK